MRIKDQVVNLDLSKKLKELGIKQESEFHWANHPKKSNEYIILHSGDKDDSSFILVKSLATLLVSAFTAQELSRYLQNQDGGLFFNITRVKDKWSVHYNPERGTDNSYWFENENLADALAEMLIVQYKEGEGVLYKGKNK